MEQNKARISVYYDGACPQCVKDRHNYEKLSGPLKDDIQWIDITGNESLLRSMGIDPKRALMELHVKDEKQQILSEIDAYILLMRKVPVLKPLAIIIGLPIVRPILSKSLSLDGKSQVAPDWKDVTNKRILPHFAYRSVAQPEMLMSRYFLPLTITTDPPTQNAYCIKSDVFLHRGQNVQDRLYLSHRRSCTF